MWKRLVARFLKYASKKGKTFDVPKCLMRRQYFEWFHDISTKIEKQCQTHKSIFTEQLALLFYKNIIN